MTALRVAAAGWWRGFDSADLVVRFPELLECAEVDFVDDPNAADLVMYSCFENGEKTLRPRSPVPSSASAEPRSKRTPVRLFYTAENVRPDFRECDFAISFSREICDPRHLRWPNSIGALRSCGRDLDALERPRPSVEEAAALRRAKARFCAYVQGNRVPFREDFVRKLSRYKKVDCGGPSLNNLGKTVNRREKYELFAESKFAVTFENEDCLGYVTEKLPDALAVDCVPIYWGDPTVTMDFDPRSFVHVRSAADVDDAIERIIALDRDDGAYDAMLRAPRFPNGETPEDYAPATAKAFFEKVVAAARG